MSDPTRFETRRERLTTILAREQFDAFLVTTEHNVGYLTGFTGDSTYLLVTGRGATAISDFRYVTQLAEECPGLPASIRPPSVKLPDATIALLNDAKPCRLGIEAHTMPVELFQHIEKCLTGVELVPQSGVIENELRAIKDAAELATLRRAVDAAISAFREIAARPLGDQSERIIAFDLEHIARGLGAEKLSFPAIIAGGDRAALPHYRPGRRAVAGQEMLLIDWGCEVDGYKSDLTRTMPLGEPTARFREVYDVVLRAHAAAVEAIAPGVKCADVDATARNLIAEAGFGENFGHGLGHGIGLDIHEQPRFSPISTDVLAPGMVVTVEPGIYLPGWGGVRIEDDVLVTDGGCEILSGALPRRLDELPVFAA